METARAKAKSTKAPARTAANQPTGRSKTSAGPGASPVNSGTDGKEKCAADDPRHRPGEQASRADDAELACHGADEAASRQPDRAEGDGFDGASSGVGRDGKEHRPDGEQGALGRDDEEELEGECRAVVVEAGLYRLRRADP